MKSRTLHTILSALAGWILPLLFVGAWDLLSRHSVVNAYVFVPVSHIVSSLQELIASGDLWVNLRASLARTCLGLVIGIVAGITTGSLMATFRLFERLVGPLYNALRQVPILGLVPLIGLWFGSGEFSKVLMVVLAAFYPTVLNTYEGLRHVEKRYLEVGQMLTLTRRQTFIRILLPSALPSIFTGMSHALAFAWLSAMGAELLFNVGPGLGAVLSIAGNAGRMDTTIVCVVLIALLGYAMNSVFARLGRYLIRGQPVKP